MRTVVSRGGGLTLLVMLLALFAAGWLVSATPDAWHFGQRAEVQPRRIVSADGVLLAREGAAPALAAHYVHAVRQQFAAWAAQRGVDAARGGMTVHATLDTRLQAAAEQAVRRQAELHALHAGLHDLVMQTQHAHKARLETGFVALDLRDGAVRAFVGSPDGAVAPAPGNNPVTLLEMARGYATLAALGIQREPQLIARITDRHGVEVARFSAPGQRVLEQASALELVALMHDAVARGTGTLLRQRFGLHTDTAGQAGTPPQRSDGWLLAMRPGLVAAAWVGFDDPRIALRASRWGPGRRDALLQVVDDFLAGAGDAALIGTHDGLAADRVPLPPIALPQALDDNLGARDGGADASDDAARTRLLPTVPRHEGLREPVLRDHDRDAALMLVGRRAHDTLRPGR